MNTKFIFLATALACAAPTFAQPPGTEIKVQRRTHDRQDKADRANNVYTVTRGLSVTVKNTDLDAAAGGEVEWAILVVRPSMAKHLLVSGKEPLPGLEPGKTATFEVGSVPMQEAGANRQDMEYQVIVRRGGIEAARVETTASFDEMASASREKGKKGKAGKKN